VDCGPGGWQEPQALPFPLPVRRPDPSAVKPAAAKPARKRGRPRKGEEAPATTFRRALSGRLPA
jgi:hypothetical protein